MTEKRPLPKPCYYRPQAVAVILSISRPKVYDMINRGLLHALKIDTSVVVSAVELQLFERQLVDYRPGVANLTFFQISIIVPV